MTEHDDKFYEDDAERFEAFLDGLDPSTLERHDATYLRAIGEAVDALETAEARLNAAIQFARQNGEEWGLINLLLSDSPVTKDRHYGPTAPSDAS
ncbi:hypothetical protein [Gryllotalpicola sp.]|uniref:hypothetical protein n=1 Tax=Gryllotalpicola sp. TaxID=1932787 RepID=UPI0026279FBB|nr:hypothetical protein [Gryllotalpicola sp.]